jgi:hypothetical protein
MGAWFGRLGLLAMVLAALLPASTGAQGASAEQQLAEKYAPIARVREQERACDTSGEPYLPMPVEVVFDDPEVLLKRGQSPDEARDPVVAAAPDAQDLAGKDATHYLDLPENPRLPGCSYEHWARARMDVLGLEPTVYARIATDPDAPGKLALQYWFYWVFNDFNNTHESDWEMVQLTFEATSAEAALAQEPVDVAFAQHGGGERADWDDGKLEKDGTRLIVYPAAGSHATYYGDAIWIGWGPGGTGFGCDDTSSPHVEVPLHVVLLPDDPDPDGPFAWLLFEGRWGERQPWEFNGPLSPNAGSKWLTPVSWTDGIRSSSLAISGNQLIGPGPATLFCTISGFAGSTMTSMPVSPLLIAYQVAAFALALVLLALWNGRYIARAVRVFTRYPLLFLPLSLSLLPVAGVGGLLERLLRTTDAGDVVADQFSGGNASAILGTGVAGFQQFLLLVLVAPAIIHATSTVTRQHTTGFGESWGVALGRWPATAGATLFNMLLIALMTLTVVLIPLAIYRGVQWLYTPHAVIIDGASWREARHVSRARVRGRWWRTLALSALVWLVSGAPGPILANAMLLAGVISLDVAEIVSSVIYAISFAIAIITTTLYYQRIGDVAVPEARVSPRGPAPAPEVVGRSTLTPDAPPA